ncbi:hypothetical protein ACN47E_002019 [Coniothyrium glycines]
MAIHNDLECTTHPLHVAQQAAYIGAAAAIPGTAVGAFFGTLRTQTPVLFALVSGAQWFAIGSTFYGVRASVLNHTGLLNWWNATRGKPLLPRDDLHPSPSDKIRASTIAGAFTGSSLGLLFRGPRNVIPGTIMFTLFGWVGQTGYNHLDARNSTEIQHQAALRAQGEERPKEPWVYRFAKSKWSPVSVLSDEEYIKMQEEKLLRVEAEIAIIDEKIAEFKSKASALNAQRLAMEAQQQNQQQQK